MRLLLLFILAPMIMWAEVRILVLGDSNTHGIPSKDYSWVTLLKEEYKDKPWVKFYNYGLGMATAEQCEMLLHIGIELHDPDIVIYTGGLVNVVFKGDLDKHLGPSIGRTIQHCIDNKIYVLFGMIDFSSFCKNLGFNKPYVDRANGVYRDIAITFQDYILPFIFLEDRLLCDPALNTGDWLHPNLEGQKIIALRVNQALEPIINLPYEMMREVKNRYKNPHLSELHPDCP